MQKCKALTKIIDNLFIHFAANCLRCANKKYRSGPYIYFYVTFAIKIMTDKKIANPCIPLRLFHTVLFS